MTIRTNTAALIGLALIGLPRMAVAETSTEQAAANPASLPAKPLKNGACAAIYVSVAALSDYRFDGFSESNRQPTWQAVVHCYRTDGFYVGTELTGVNFEDRPRTTFETDFYAGKHIAVAGSGLNLELLYTWFPDQRTRGPSYSMLESEAELSRSFGQLTLKGQLAWSPDNSGDTGQSWHVKGSAAYAVTPWLTFSGHAGQIWIARGQGRTVFDLGATATWKRLSLDARYGGTNLKVSQCYYTNWCSPGASATVGYSFLL